MKSTTIILILLATSTLAQDENCKDHPWAQRNLLKRLKTNLEISNDSQFNVLTDIFSSDSSATASTTLSAETHPLINQAYQQWLETDVKSCCTQEAYNQILQVPNTLIQYISQNMAPYERILAGLPKGLKSCGTKKIQDQDGEEQDPESLNVLQMMAGIEIESQIDISGETNSDGEKDQSILDTNIDAEVAVSASVDLQLKKGGNRFLQEANASGSANVQTTVAVQSLKRYFIAKARLIRDWVQFQRGSLLFLCRLPSKAKAALKGDKQALKVKMVSYNKLKVSYEKNLQIIKACIAEFKQFVTKAIEIFGGENCANAAVSISKKFDVKAVCEEENCTGFKAKVLSLSSLKFLIGKLPKASDDFAAFFGVDINANGHGNVRRNLQSETEEADPEPAEDSDPDAVSSVSVESDSQITVGGPYQADGNCAKEGCDKQFSAKTSFVAEVNNDQKSTNSSNLVALSLSLLAVASLLLF